MTPAETTAQRLATDSIAHQGNQHIVGLPVKSSERPPANFAIAKSQLDQPFSSTFAKDTKLKEEYLQLIQRYLDAGCIENVPLQPQSGPSLTALSHDRLLDFRCNAFACVADISNAFHRVQVAVQDRPYLRSLSYEDEKLQCFEFTMVPVGTPCSPYLPQFTLQYYCNMEFPSTAVNTSSYLHMFSDALNEAYDTVTDSSVCILQLRNSERHRDVFVANRMHEIAIVANPFALQEPVFNLQYANSLTKFMHVVDRLCSFINKCRPQSPAVSSSLNLLIFQEQILFISLIFHHFTHSAPLNHSNIGIVVCFNLRFCEERRLVVACTRVMQDGKPIDLPFVTRESCLQQLILQDIHERHHHCPAPTTAALFKSDFMSNALCVSSKAVTNNRICRRDRGLPPITSPLPAPPPARTALIRPPDRSGIDHTTVQTIRHSYQLRGGTRYTPQVGDVVQAVRHFHASSQSQYLMSLRLQRHPLRGGTRYTPQVGDVVMKSSQKHRADWPLARVTELLTSADGIVRSVRLFTGSSYLDRDPRTLLPFECHSEEEPPLEAHNAQGPPLEAPNVPVTEVTLQEILQEDYHDDQAQQLPDEDVNTSPDALVVYRERPHRAAARVANARITSPATHLQEEE